MKYFQTWQDFMRQAEMMELKESKGIHACKQRYIQEQNKMQWYDPMILTEATQDAGQLNAANAVNVQNTPYITGNTAEITTIGWSELQTNSLTSSTDADWSETTNYFDVEGFYLGGDGSTADYNAGHTNSRYKFRCFLTTGSRHAHTKPDGHYGIITASLLEVPIGLSGITGSILHGLKHSINSAGASAVVGGITNGTIAPSTFFTATLNGASSSLTITNDNVGSVQSAEATYPNTISGSITASTTTNGLDTWEYDQGTQTFDAARLPYSNFPRK